MKRFHFLSEGPVQLALTAVFGLGVDEGEVQVTTNIAEADCIIAISRAELNRVIAQHPSKLYACFEGNPRNPQFAGLPENVIVLTLGNLIRQMIDKVWPLIKDNSAEMPAPETPVTTASPMDAVTPVKFIGKYRVLVIDDNEANRDGAVSLLTRAGHSVTVLSAFHIGMEKVAQAGKFDAVLTDMHMPVLRFGPLAETAVNPVGSETVGFAIMLLATASGYPVAVVTDANHHQNWSSAVFDTMKSAQVNGQKVLFFNNIGKRWDQALLALMEG